MTITLRAATPADAPAMAELANIAGEGLPGMIWKAQANHGEDAMAVGRVQASRADGPFSWTQAIMAEVDGATAGMLITQLTPEVPEGFDEDTHPMVRPLVVLEGKAPATRYINVLATFDRFRRKGVGKVLMKKAEENPGPNGMSLITTDCNTAGQAFYQSLGYRRECSVPIMKGDWDMPGQEWVLMRKP